jgi:Eukaryotic aspartyl protease
MDNFKLYQEYMSTKHPELVCLGAYPIINVCYIPGKTCEEYHSKFPNLTIQLSDDKGFHVPPKSYLKTEKQSDGKTNCFSLVIYSSVYDSVVLGDVFLENYYTVYDFENNTISFNGWVQTGLGLKPSRKNDKFKTIIIVILICVVLVGAGAGTVIFIKKRNSKLQQNLQLYSQLDGGAPEHDLY